MNGTPHLNKEDVILKEYLGIEDLTNFSSIPKMNRRSMKYGSFEMFDWKCPFMSLAKLFRLKSIYKSVPC